MTQTQFDPAKFKSTTREQWQTAADAWHAWGPTLGSWLGEATEMMLDMAGVRAGSRVLDVAAGAGEQSVTAARRVGPTGHVLATDLSSRILELAAQHAAESGVHNLETREMDGENLDLEPGSFDAVISRVGMIYFPDRMKALAGFRRVLKPGGRFATVVYSTAEANGFFSVPVGIIRRRANLPPPLPGQPGPFSLGAPGVLEKVLEDAGFHDVESRVLDAPLKMPRAADCLRFEKESFGALHQMLVSLSESEQQEAWNEVEEALEKYEDEHGFHGPCELVIASGVN